MVALDLPKGQWLQAYKTIVPSAPHQTCQQDYNPKHTSLVLQIKIKLSQTHLTGAANRTRVPSPPHRTRVPTPKHTSQDLPTGHSTQPNLTGLQSQAYLTGSSNRTMTPAYIYFPQQDNDAKLNFTEPSRGHRSQAYFTSHQDLVEKEP